MQLSTIVTREDTFFIAFAPDVDIASQGETMEEALTNLKEALNLYFEDKDAVRPQVRG
ncbi:MAG: type II toxin-antitoxin system HicB family antitoxin [Candidatus Thorarchaeota archaeon]